MNNTVDNRSKFTGRAEVYSKHRPNYAKDFIDYLIDKNSLNAESVIADIGSGTGILSRQLLEKGLKVIAIEPNADMRKAAEEGLGSFSGFTSMNASAENTGLGNGSVDLITAAQAFHWFDKERFKAECKRILKPGSNVTFVWNSREADAEIVIETEKVFNDLCPLFKGFSGGIDDTPDVFEMFFREGIYEHRVFRNDLKYDFEGFIGRSLSASYSPKAGEPNYDKFIEEMTKIFEKYGSDGFILMPNITRSYTGKV